MKIRTFFYNFSLLGAPLAVFLITAQGCLSRSEEPIRPPKNKQQEKQYITKDKKKTNEIAPITTTVKTDDTSVNNDITRKITISVSADKHRNINKVEANGIDGNGFLNNNNFVVRWNILGPFPCPTSAPKKTTQPGEQTATPEKISRSAEQAALHHKLMKDEKKLSGVESTGDYKWLLARFESPKRPGEINLRDFFKNKQGQFTAYAVTYLQCPKKLPYLTLYTGSSGYIKVWINHQLVHTYDHNPRQGKWDQDVIKNIELRKGYNQIVVKCVSTSNDWNFYFRLADAQNLPMKFIPVDNSKNDNKK